MNPVLETLGSHVRDALGDKLLGIECFADELTIRIDPRHWREAARILRDDPRLRFEQMIDLCGLDYLEYGDGLWEDARFCVAVHLLSLSGNRRLRVKGFCAEDDFPMIDSLVEVWPVANWFEREAFDLFGIVFVGHPDLRRILTDYGFVGHPFRKDFPLSGNVEMRYDPEQGRVIYEPVSIEERVTVPRIIREENYGG